MQSFPVIVLDFFRNGCVKIFVCFMFEFRKIICSFDVNKLLMMTEFYPNDCIDVSEVVFRHQLKNYVINVRSDPKFAKLKGLRSLSASVKGVFLAMKVVKSNLCNKMDDH
ncbi:hypothetical protein MTR_2g076500 [Medicago truncatula]|uniref:Uncharacterized protein n=1 Tax=Medicago truncatula TaxID=3880 RepID=G7IH58_MEDTR|nr:hypothetical protein MTR_2g076500 [Medicago truncatula]